MNKVRKTLKEQKKQQDKSELSKQIRYKETIVKRKALIQKLYYASITNQLYIFPRICNPISSESSSSTSSQQQLSISHYNLKQQNKKDQGHQIHFLEKPKIRTNKNQSNQFKSINQTKKVVKQSSNYNSINNQSKKANQKADKGDRIQRFYFSKGRINSTQKFANDQLSNDKKNTKHLYSSQKSCRNQQTAQNSKNLVISFRGTKKHEINVSLTRKRLKTQY